MNFSFGTGKLPLFRGQKIKVEMSMTSVEYQQTTRLAIWYGTHVIEASGHLQNIYQLLLYYLKVMVYCHFRYSQ